MTQFIELRVGCLLWLLLDRLKGPGRSLRVGRSLRSGVMLPGPWSWFSFFAVWFFKKIICIYLFYISDVLGLRCFVRAFASCSEGYPLLWCASLSLCSFSFCGAQGSEVVVNRFYCSSVCGIFPDQGSNRYPLASADKFLSTVSPGKSCCMIWGKLPNLLSSSSLIGTSVTHENDNPMALSLRDWNEEMYIQPLIQNLTQVLSLFHYYYYSYLCLLQLVQLLTHSFQALWGAFIRRKYCGEF